MDQGAHGALQLPATGCVHQWYVSVHQRVSSMFGLVGCGAHGPQLQKPHHMLGLRLWQLLPNWLVPKPPAAAGCWKLPTGGVRQWTKALMREGPEELLVLPSRTRLGGSLKHATLGLFTRPNMILLDVVCAAWRHAFVATSSRRGEHFLQRCSPVRHCACMLV